MTSLSDGMLGAHPRGARLKTTAGDDASRHQFYASLHQNLRPPDNVFHGSAVLQGFPPAWP